jgi:hypothetical protein
MIVGFTSIYVFCNEIPITNYVCDFEACGTSWRESIYKWSLVSSHFEFHNETKIMLNVNDYSSIISTTFGSNRASVL